MSSKSNNKLDLLAVIIIGIVSMLVGVIIAVNSESIGYFIAAVCFGFGVLISGLTGMVSKLNTLHSVGAIICIILAILVFGFKSCSDGIDKTLDKTPRRIHHHYYNGSHSENTSSHDYTVQFLEMKERA